MLHDLSVIRSNPPDIQFLHIEERVPVLFGAGENI